MAEQIIDGVISLGTSPTTWNIITSRIKNHMFKIAESDANIYCTLFNRFKKHHPLDEVNEMILKSISSYRQDGKDCSYKIKDTSFTLIPYYTYVQPDFIDFGFRESEHQVYPNEPKFTISVPSVSRVTIYVFFEQNTKKSIANCQTLLEQIQKKLLKELDVRQQGKFLYLNVNNIETRDKILKKIKNKYNRDGYMLENKSGADDEIKIKYSDFLFRILSNLLKT